MAKKIIIENIELGDTGSLSKDKINKNFNSLNTSVDNLESNYFKKTDVTAQLGNSQRKVPSEQAVSLALKNKASQTSIDQISNVVYANRSNIKNLSEKMDKKADKSDVSVGLINKGSVPTIENLPIDGNTKGDAYYVVSEGFIYQYDGTKWNKTVFTAFPNNMLTKKDIVNSLGNDKEKVVSQDLLTSALSGFNFKYYKSFLYNSAAQSVHAVVSDGVDHYYIGARNFTLLSVQKDFIQLAAIPRDVSIGRINACLDGDTIHIIVSNAYTYSSGKNRIDYYTYSIKSKSLVFVSSLNFGNDHYECWSVIKFKNSIYAAISYKTTYKESTKSNTYTNSKAIVSLYEIKNSVFQRVSDVATPDDVWGYSLEYNKKNYYSLPKGGYFRATLSTDGNYLYCTYIGTTYTPLASYLAFTKKTSDVQNWTNDEILSNARCNYSNVIHYNNQKIYISKAYKDNSFKYSQADIVFCLNGRFHKGYYGLLPILNDIAEPANENYNICETPDSVVISFSYVFKDGRNNSAAKIIVLDKKDIYDKLRGSIVRDRGLFSKMEMNNLSIGDSFILDKSEKTNIPVWTFPYINSIRKEYLSISKNEKVRATFNGSELGWNIVPLQTPNSRIDSIVFEHNAQFNPFFSSNFRIPCLTDSPDGNILYATSDIRYFSGNDIDIIEVGFCRSLDNGRTWQDYGKIFRRDNNANILNRVHDCSLCVDRNINSPHYGRIWAFAKMIDTDLPEDKWENAGFMSFLSCYSDDEGLTWSDQKALKGLFPGEAFHTSTGVSAGITLKDGTLIQPTYFTRKENGVKAQRAFFIYSKDGETWQAGDITSGYGGENTIVQMTDGKLLMNARDAFSSGNANRRVYILDSIGSGWVNKPEYETLQTVNCQESLAYNRGVYLYSQPTGYIDRTGRNRITIFKSKDLIHWESFITVTNAPSRGYSTLIFRDNKLGILFEDIDPYDIVYANLDYLLPLIYF